MFRKTLFLLIAFVLLSRYVLSQNHKVIVTASETKPRYLAYSPTVPNRIETPSVFSALPSFDKEIKTSVRTADARAEIVRQYLRKYNSPLEPEANLIVELADENNFDYRWMVAIAQQESNLCKVIPIDSYNCWGWGIYPDPKNPEVLKVTRFDSFEDALRRIAPQFTRIFLKGKHMKDPNEVMKTYTPPSDGSWANGVNQFFGDLE